MVYMVIGAVVLAAVAGLATTLAVRRSARYVSSKDILTSCIANNSEAVCSFTNTSSAVVTTCVQSKVTQKKASGVALASHPVCSGPLAPFETKNVSAHWVGGLVKDICNKKIGDSEFLDWDQCEFNTSPFEPK